MLAASPPPLTLPTALFAAAAPSLLAYNVAPSPTFLNQALALIGWGLFVAMVGGRANARRGDGLLLVALAGVGAGVLLSWLPGALPAGLALSALGLLMAAALLVMSGAAVRGRADGSAVFGWFCVGWVGAGLLNSAIGIVQVFAPTWADGEWIARSGLVGRAIGNLRQPNHLSSLLLWACIGVVALAELGRLRRGAAALLMTLFVFVVVLTASRTGLLSVGVLAAWGLIDRRLTRSTRTLLMVTPLLYAAAWGAMVGWAQLGAHAFGGEARLAETDISGSRFGIWANALDLLRQQPLTGVGFGEFNLAWSLTPFPGRPAAFFDHTHNLPLQLLVELGVPLGGAVLLLLLIALWQPLAARGAQEVSGRCAWMMVLMIGVHSLLEYPLWYAYFLLPAAWAWGYALGWPRPAAAQGGVPTDSGGVLAVAGIVLVVGGLASVADYQRVTVIFEARDDAAPLEERIADGRRSVLFAHHADYAAATTGIAVDGDPLAPFNLASHYLLDTRLMTAWAQTLFRVGDVDRARYVAARLREFRNPASETFFAACDNPALAPLSFQCRPPAQPHGWREFTWP